MSCFEGGGWERRIRDPLRKEWLLHCKIGVSDNHKEIGYDFEVDRVIIHIPICDCQRSNFGVGL